MRILIIQTQARWSTHLETELEIAQEHLIAGDQVEFLGCDACVRGCHANPNAGQLACNECRARRATGRTLLSKNCKEHQLSDYITPSILEAEEATISSVVDVDTAKNFTLNGNDLGWGAYSSSLQTIRDYLCESDEARNKLKLFTSTAYRNYFGTKEFLSCNGTYDTVYIFNGRFAATRGALRACEDNKAVREIQIHERGANQNKYELFGGKMPHNRELRRERLLEAWETADINNREKQGAFFFEERRNGTPTDWKSFTSDQMRGKLPSTWDGTKRNVAIFNSSEDEFAGIGTEWKNPLYDSQYEGICQIAKDASTRFPKLHFHLRMHPNLIGVDHLDLRRTRAIELPNLTVIPPESNVSTYDLLDASDTVITFGSTMGVEATYWGKPSIVGGRSLYENIDAAYFPASHSELFYLLGEQIAPKPKLNAIKYGYYFGTYGKDFKHYAADSFRSGKFRGVNLHEPPLLERNIRRLLKKLGRGEYRFRMMMAERHRRKAESKLKR